ncbi:MAG: heavy metal-associated domain-containing protein [Woeseiaceae bacterium]|jgi:copper chaperone
MATTLKISGMKCGGCVSSVKEALEAVAGVESADVSLEQAQAVVSGDADRDALIRSVEQAGFGASAA